MVSCLAQGFVVSRAVVCVARAPLGPPHDMTPRALWERGRATIRGGGTHGGKGTPTFASAAPFALPTLQGHAVWPYPSPSGRVGADSVGCSTSDAPAALERHAGSVSFSYVRSTWRPLALLGLALSLVGHCMLSSEGPRPFGVRRSFGRTLSLSLRPRLGEPMLVCSWAVASVGGWGRRPSSLLISARLSLLVTMLTTLSHGLCPVARPLWRLRGMLRHFPSRLAMGSLPFGACCLALHWVELGAASRPAPTPPEVVAAPGTLSAFVRTGMLGSNVAPDVGFVKSPIVVARRCLTAFQGHLFIASPAPFGGVVSHATLPIGVLTLPKAKTHSRLRGHCTLTDFVYRVWVRNALPNGSTG